MPWHLITIRAGRSYGTPLVTEAVESLKVNARLESCLRLLFGDVATQEEADLWHVPMFRISQARRVIAYLNKIHRRPGREMLVCQCMAGISRSGAVGAFAAELFGIPHRAFMIENPGVQPNGLVLRLLHEQQRVG